MTSTLAPTPKMACQNDDELHYTLNIKDIQGAVQQGDYTINSVVSFNKKATFNIAFKCSFIIRIEVSSLVDLLALLTRDLDLYVGQGGAGEF